VCSTAGRSPSLLATTAPRVRDLATSEDVAVFDFRGIGAAAFGPSVELMIAAGWDLIVFDRTARY